MTTRLDVFEKKTGRLHTTHDFDRSREKQRDAPETLTNEAVTALACFGSEDEAARARAARQRALHPRVDPPPAPAAEPPTTGDGRILRFKHIGLMMKGIARVLKERFSERDRRLEVLEARIAALETRPSLHDAGVWTHGKTYEAGAIVSHHGSAWICGVTHFSTGTDLDHTHFRLLVKRGRDAQ